MKMARRSVAASRKVAGGLPVERLAEPKELRDIGARPEEMGPVVLLVLDGCGFNPFSDDNAMVTAQMPNLVRLIEQHGCVLLRNDGETVGLHPGVFGNSDVGHQTLRGIVEPAMPVLIDNSIADGSFFKDKELNAAIDNCLKEGSALHLVGLCSDIGVHSDINHMYAMLRYARERGVKKAFVHFITDGRDATEHATLEYRVDRETRGQRTPDIIREVIDDFMGGRVQEVMARNDGYSRLMGSFLSSLRSAGYIDEHNNLIYADMQLDDILELVDSGRVAIPGYLPRAEAVFAKLEEGQKIKIETATIGGRSFYMDRNGNWGLTETAYNAMVRGEGKIVRSARSAVEDAYNSGVKSDQEVPVSVVVNEDGEPVGLIRDRDSLVFYNFRSDRMKQLVAPFVLPDFDRFSRAELKVFAVSMIRYDERFDMPILIDTIPNPAGLGMVVSVHGEEQFRTSSTEKGPHVGAVFPSFFDGQSTEPLEHEFRVLVPDPEVEEYHQKPTMSTRLVTDIAVRTIGVREKYRFMLVNFPNGDMVGHTGYETAVANGLRIVDEGIGRIWKAVDEAGGILVVTADHGNSDTLMNASIGETHREHTIRPAVTVIAPARRLGKFEYDLERMREDPDGLTIADIAPTVCQMLGYPVPPYMTGRPLGRMVYREVAGK